MVKNKRKLTGWFLLPHIKIEYVFYSLVFGGISIVLFQFLFLSWLNPMDLEATERFSVFLAVYFFICTIFGIWISHSFIGPMMAFVRHVRELQKGNYQVQTKLRKFDVFTEVKDELNLLSSVLAQRDQATGETSSAS